MWDDLRALQELVPAPWPGPVVAVNDIAVHPVFDERVGKPPDHWATLHPELLRRDNKHPERWGWKEQRERAGLPSGYLTWSRPDAQTDHCIKPVVRGSSGLLGIYVALTIADKAVAVGIPMQVLPHFSESTLHKPDRSWGSAEAHWRAWDTPECRRNLMGRFKSMSGRTREVFGAPDLEWLGHDDNPDDHLTDERLALPPV